jgi:hypothetical protein
MWNLVVRVSIAACAIILLALVRATSILASNPHQEMSGVKIERKPKFISNGPGQKPFDVTRHTVPISEIQRSVPKNSIPALVRPRFVPAALKSSAPFCESNSPTTSTFASFDVKPSSRMALRTCSIGLVACGKVWSVQPVWSGVALNFKAVLESPTIPPASPGRIPPQPSRQSK